MEATDLISRLQHLVNMGDDMEKEYEIKTKMDFLQVPEERIDACLEEFKQCLKIFRMLPEDVVRATGEFIWRDDGNPGLSSVSILADGKEIGTVKFT
jgi:hypothetical protein